MMSGSKGHNAFKLRREASPLGLDKRYDFVTRETRTSSAYFDYAERVAGVSTTQQA